MRFWMINNDDFRNCSNMSRIHRSLLSRRIQNITPSQFFCLAPVCRSDATGSLQQSKANKFSVASQSIQDEHSCTATLSPAVLHSFDSFVFLFLLLFRFLLGILILRKLQHLEFSSVSYCVHPQLPCHVKAALSRAASFNMFTRLWTSQTRPRAWNVQVISTPELGKCLGPCLSPDENKQKAHHDASSRVAE